MRRNIKKMNKMPVINGDITSFSCGDTHIGVINNYNQAAFDRTAAVRDLVNFQKVHPSLKNALRAYSNKVHGGSFYKELSDNALKDVHNYHLMLAEYVTDCTAVLDELKAELAEAKQSNTNYRQQIQEHKHSGCIICRLFYKR